MTSSRAPLIPGQVNQNRIPLSAPWFDEHEMERLRMALSGRVAGDGPFCKRVEERLSKLLGGHQPLLTTSCTHALELALLALGVGPGQEVICPSFTFVSTANAVLRVGARPVFADIEEQTLGLDPADVERRITQSTTGLMPVHYAGVAPDMADLLDLARGKGLKLVEDAAQGLGASYRGKPLGTLGDAGCFSFHETKNLTCGEGGALVLRDEEVARRAEIIREKGTNRKAFLRREVDKYTWVLEGSSYVLSDVLAALLDAQLDKWEEIQLRRTRVFDRYRVGLSDWARSHDVRLPPESPMEERQGNAHCFYVLLPDDRSQELVLARLQAQGIMAAFHYVPLHSSPFGKTLGQSQEALPVTDKVSRTLVRLPLHPLLTDADVDRVIDAVQGALV